MKETKTKPQTKQPVDRAPYEEAFMNMMSSPDYVKYSFWSFVIAKMQLTIDRSVPTAGAGFFNNNYQLIINPDFFNPLPLEQRLGILIHECQHVVLKHIFRKGERDHKLFNVAADMALNQMIERTWLPEGAIYPDLFKDEKGKTWPENRTAEQYYQLLKEEQKNQQQEKEDQEGQGDQEDQEDCENCSGSGEQDGPDGDKEECPNCKGSGKEPQEGSNNFQPKNGNPNLTGQEEITIDSHELWDKISPEDEELASQMMEGILENAMEKSRGNAPGNMEMLLSLWKTKPVISWKKVMKKYISSKVGGKRGTIKRRDRRQPHRIEIKGKRSFYDTPQVIVGLDTSGSMSNEEIANALVEINEVCKVTKSKLNIVQIDTDIKGSEEYDPKKKDFKRKGCGGTYMGAMAEYLIEEKINYDVMILISDMYIEDVSTDKNWARVKKPTLWLNTSGTSVSWEGLKNHKIMDIHKA